MDDPNKNWKITPQDWAAREKWDDYSAAIDEMLERTSTTYAPWTVVASNDKNHARIKTLRTIVTAVQVGGIDPSPDDNRKALIAKPATFIGSFPFQESIYR